MKRTHGASKRILALVLTMLMVITSVPALSLVAFAEGISALLEDELPRYELNFNKGWKFNLGDVNGAQSTGYSDAAWKSVNLPHDFSIIQNFTTSGTEGESGNLPGGTGWYRKSFVMPSDYAGRSVIINFGASYCETQVYVNGTLMGENLYGYNPFSFDISDYLKFDGTTNMIAVKVKNPIPNSRFYSGSGLIGDVTMTIVNPVHVSLYGTQITTPNLASSNGTNGTTNVAVTLQNDGTSAASGYTVTATATKGGTTVGTATQTASLSVGATQTVTLSMSVNNPQLWSTTTPNLYNMHVEIKNGNEVVDSYDTTYGYTWSSWDNSTGFYLNGQKLKLQGVCMHLDQGALGTAAEYDAFYRQVKILKEMGVNAIRTSHNIFPTSYYDVCNELGMLVMEEFFDGWTTNKNSNYNAFGNYFNNTISSSNKNIDALGKKWYQYIITQTVKRDRNYPCIFTWDVGNELDDVNATNISSDMKTIIDGLDSRPILWGNNKGSAQSIDQHMDIFGGNYNIGKYITIGTGSGFGMPFVGTETASAIGSRGEYSWTSSNWSKSGTSYEHNMNYASSNNWQVSAYDSAKVGWGNTAADAWYKTITYDWNAGEFVWTGFDYIGEPTPWNAYKNAAPAAYPNSSYFGIIDTAGFAKDSYYLYNSWWDTSETTLHITPGTWNAEHLVVSSGYVDVAVYTNANYIELLCNGSVIATATATTHTTGAGYTYKTYTENIENSSKCRVGTLDGSDDHNMYPLFEVAYTSSDVITAKAYDRQGGTEITNTVGTKQVKANTASAIQVSAWNNDTTLTADADSFNYVEITAVDSQGNFANDYNGTLNITLTGEGKIAGVDNGNAASTQKFQTPSAIKSDKSAQVQMFNGKALVIVQSTEETGSINLTVSPTDGKAAKSIGMTSVAETGAELTDEFEEAINQNVTPDQGTDTSTELEDRYNLLKENIEAIETPVEGDHYTNYTVGSSVPEYVPTGTYILVGENGSSSGVLNTTVSSTGKLDTSGTEPTSTSQTFAFTRKENGKYTIAFTGQNVTNEFLNISADGITIGVAPQDLDVTYSNGTVTIGDGTNFITYSANETNKAGVSVTGTPLKLYTLSAARSANGVSRWGDVGIIEDGTYVIWGQVGTVGYVMTPNPVSNSSGTKTGLDRAAAEPVDGVLDTDAANEVIVTKVEGTEHDYTIQLSTGKYLKIENTNSKVSVSDDPVTVQIVASSLENRPKIMSGYNGTGGQCLNIFDDSDAQFFCNWVQNALTADVNQCFAFYKQSVGATAEDVALYTALNNALKAQPGGYTDATYTTLLDAMQSGYETYTNDSATAEEKTAAATAVNTAYSTLKSDGVTISPTLKEDINALPEPSTGSSRYEKYVATSGTQIPDGQYIVVATDAGSSSNNVMSGTAKSYSASGEGNNGTVWGYLRSTGTVSGNLITTSEANEWTIKYDSASGKYSLRNAAGKYMNIDANTRLLVQNSDTETFVTIDPRSDGTVFIKNGTQFLQNQDTQSRPMFSTWQINSPPPTGSQNYITLYRKIVEYADSQAKRNLYSALKDNNIDQGYYTSLTYKKLQEALQTGLDTYNDPNATDADYSTAKANIEAAAAALKMGNMKPVLEDKINNLTDPNFLSFSKYTVTDAESIPTGIYLLTGLNLNSGSTIHMLTNNAGTTAGTLTTSSWTLDNNVATVSDRNFMFEISHITGTTNQYYIKSVATGQYLHIPSSATGNGTHLTMSDTACALTLDNHSGNISIRIPNGRSTGGDGSDLFVDYYSGAYSTWGKNMSAVGDNNKFVLYRNDRDVLKEALQKGIAKDQDTYTKESYDALLTALDAGVNVYNTVGASTQNINAATTAINTAIDNLVDKYREKNIDNEIAGLSAPLAEDLIGGTVYERYRANYQYTSQSPIEPGEYVIGHEDNMSTLDAARLMYNSQNNAAAGHLDGGTGDKYNSNADLISNSYNEYVYIFELVPGTKDHYYIKSKASGNYINMNQSTQGQHSVSAGDITLGASSTKTEFIVKAVSGTDSSSRPVTGKVQIYYAGYSGSPSKELFLEMEVPTSGSRTFTSWASVPGVTSGKNAISLFRSRTLIDLDMLYDALTFAKDVDGSVYTEETLSDFLDAVEDGIDVYKNSSSEEAQRTAANAIYDAYEKLEPADLRQFLRDQINNLTPPAGAQTYYKRYTAAYVANDIIPDGEYVIYGEYDATTQDYGASGVMTHTYVTDPGATWTGMGYAPSGGPATVNSDKWFIERDESTGYYRISKLYGNTKQYLYCKEGIRNDDYYLSYTTEGTDLYNERALWMAEIQEDGRVIFKLATGKHAAITYTGEQGHVDGDISSDKDPYITTIEAGPGTPLELSRVEMNRLVKWNVPVADGKYIITNHGTDEPQDDIVITRLMTTTSVTLSGSTGMSREQNVSISTAEEINTSSANEYNFARVVGTNDRYYITNNSGQYLKIAGQDNVIFDSEQTQLIVEADSYGNVIIKDSGNTVYLDSYANKQLFSAWANTTPNVNNKMRLFNANRFVDDSAKAQLLEKLYEAIAIDQGKYTDDSYDNLLQAIEDGIDSYNNDTTDTQWLTARDNIQAAIDALYIPPTIETFGATLYKYGYTKSSDYSDGGKDFNQIAINEMAQKIKSTPALLSQVEALVDGATGTFSGTERATAIDAVVNEYAKLYTLRFWGDAVHGGGVNLADSNYATFWNLWEKSGTKASTEDRNQGASIQGIFSTTLDANGLPTHHANYATLPYINGTITQDPQISGTNGGIDGLHSLKTLSITKGGSSRSITLPALNNVSIYVPDYFSKNDILSSTSLGSAATETYAKHYWNVAFPFIATSNQYGVTNYVYDATDQSYAFQASFDDDTHTATAKLTDVTGNQGKVTAADNQQVRGFYPFNNRLDGSNANMSSIEQAVYHYGMSFTTQFNLPVAGHYGDNQDIIFDFVGDDDVLVYIDNVLILDNSGLHGARDAKINFTDKSITYQFIGEVETGTITNSHSEGITYTYGATNTGISAQNAAALEYLNKIATDGEMHTFSFFFLERGSSESNCRIEFNIQKISDNVHLLDQSYVLDYGLPIEANVKDNNEVIAVDGYTPKYEYIGVSTSVPLEAEAGLMFRTPDAQEVQWFNSNSELTFATTYGQVTAKNDGSIKYTLTSTHLENSGAVYFCAKVTDDPTYDVGTVYYMFEKVTLIPATTIYFEDDFAEGATDGMLYTNGTVPRGETNSNNYGVWEIVTNDQDGNVPAITMQNSSSFHYAASDVYGHDEGYEQFAFYSNAGAHKVNVSVKNNPNSKYSGGEGASWPKAEFNFSGTGVDIISLTSKNTGAVNIVITDEDGNIVENNTVNTYYGYQYGQLYRDASGKETLTAEGNTPLYFTTGLDYSTTPSYYNDKNEVVAEDTGNPAYAKGWIMGTGVAEDVDNAMYQVPILKINDLDYGTYNVTITPMYSSRMDSAKNGNYDFYLDAVRVYNPAGYGNTLTDPTIAYTYTNDKEGNSDYLELRDMIIGTDKLTIGTYAEGAVFVDGITDNDDVSLYKAGGPNNEIYLSRNQAIAFEIWATAIPDDLQIGARCAGTTNDGFGTSRLEIVYTNGTTTVTGGTSVSTATDLNYSVDGLLRTTNPDSPGQLNWTPVVDANGDPVLGEDGKQYYTSGVVVVKNTGAGILGITSVKWNFAVSGVGYYQNSKALTAAADEPVVAMMSNYNTFAKTRMALRMNYADLDVSQDSVEISNASPVAGEDVTVKVTTSADVETLVIRDNDGNVITPEKLESFVETIDNEEVKVWEVTLKQNEAGEYVYFITGAYENGYEGGAPAVITVNVGEVPETELPDGSGEPVEGPSFFEQLVGFFNRIIEFFKMLVSLFTGELQ